MNISIHHKCQEFNSYRTACIRSLYNVDNTDFTLEAVLPLEEEPWQVGLIVGSSGSGKSSLGEQIWGHDYLYQPQDWSTDKPIVDDILPEGNWEAITSALSAVGLGSVPSWLRPYKCLSQGEKFRADLARIISEAPEKIVIDEFTSVVDRQIAQVGAGAFAKAWRRTNGQAILLSCHYDIIDWLAPDWVFDTNTKTFTRTRGRLRRPKLELEIYQTNWQYWEMFEPHHYLKLPKMIASYCYVGFINDKPVCHLGITTLAGQKEARIARLVVLPEWQGIGIGVQFVNEICRLWRLGYNRYNKPMRTILHTSHPGLANSLRKNKHWTQISGLLYGDNKARCARSLTQSAIKNNKATANCGFGGHFRAIQGFRYLE